MPPDNVFEFLEIASQAAVGGVTDLETAVDGLTTSTNAFGAQGLTTTQAADTLFTAVRLGKTTFEELSRSIGTVAPLASASGVSFGELNTQIAQLTTGGFRTSEAATAIRAAIQGLLRPSNDLNDIWARAGFESGQAAIEALGLAGAMDIVAQAADGDIGELTALVGSVEAVNSILGVTGDNAGSFNEKLLAMEDSAGAAGKAFQVVADSDAQKLEESLNRLNNATERLGAELLPGLAATAEAVGNVISGQSGLFEQSVNDGLLGWILRVGDESRFTTPAIMDVAKAVTEATESDDKWAGTLTQITRLQNDVTVSSRKRISADDELVDVEISLLEVEQTRIKILASLTAQTAAYNNQQRVQADNLAAVSRATGIAESATGDYELSIVQINRAGREQAARLTENAARLADYEAAVRGGDAVTAGHERTLENYGRTIDVVTGSLGGGGGAGGGGLTQAEQDADAALRTYNQTLQEATGIVNAWGLEGQYATDTFAALTAFGIVPNQTETEILTNLIRFLGEEQGFTSAQVETATSSILAQREAFIRDRDAADDLAESLNRARSAQERLAGRRSSAQASTAAGAVDQRIRGAVDRGELSEFDAATIRVNVRDALSTFTQEQKREVFEGTSDEILFGRVPSLAEGGIVRRPTLAVVGDRSDGRPEVISALPRDGSIGGGMTVNIQGDVYAQDGYAFADKVTEALRRRGLVAVA